MNMPLNFIKEHWLAMSLGTVALVLFLIEHCFTIGTNALEFHVREPAESQLAQLLSCHFLHWSSQHLVWDLGVFIILCGIGERISRIGATTVLAASSFLIPIAVSSFHNEFETYRGLSGLDTALFGWVVTWFAIDSWKKSDHVAAAFCGFLLLAMVAKTFHEFSTGTIFVNDDSFSPVPIAHVIGGLIGISAAATALWKNRVLRSW